MFIYTDVYTASHKTTKSIHLLPKHTQTPNYNLNNKMKHLFNKDPLEPFWTQGRGRLPGLRDW